MGDPRQLQGDEGSLFAEYHPQLRRIVGTSDIKDFSAPAKSNLDTLFNGDAGFGQLDGLVYASADDKTHIVVTTEALLGHWLRAHKDWWGPAVANVPQDVDAALKSEAFYTQALNTDAAISKYAELPLPRPAQAKLAFAMQRMGRHEDAVAAFRHALKREPESASLQHAQGFVNRTSDVQVVDDRVFQHAFRIDDEQSAQGDVRFFDQNVISA